MNSPNSQFSEAENAAIEHFRSRFGREPSYLATSPGRVNLIGEHVDYNGGMVLPFAIERTLTLVAAVSETVDTWQVKSTATGRDESFSIRAPISCHRKGTPSYLAGVVAGYQRLGFEIPALDILIHSTIPVGSGLSSSAALTVATSELIHQVCGRITDSQQRIAICQQSESEFAGTPCGVMDQSACVLARKNHLLALHCDLDRYHWVGWPTNAPSFVIVNSGVRRELSSRDSEYTRRRRACESAARKLGVAKLYEIGESRLVEMKSRLTPEEFHRAHHVATEVARVDSSIIAIDGENWDTLGHRMNESHASLRDYFEVSCAELDWIVSSAIQVRGALGARLTGAGMGGCAVILAESTAVEELSWVVRKKFEQQFSRVPELFCTTPQAGVRGALL